MNNTVRAVESPELDDWLITAFNAARSGSGKLLDAYAELVKGRWDGPPPAVEAPARDSEREIRRILYEAFPDHPVHVGEGPAPGETADYFWRADPLDGARAFRRGSPFFSVSLSLVGRNQEGNHETVLGVVLAPVLMEMFWAVSGGGSFQCRQVPGIGLCEGPISVSDCGRCEEAAVRTGLPDGAPAQGQREASARVLGVAQSLTAEESSSLGLAYVAAGRAEGFFQAVPDPWGTAAGALLVTEAGGRVTGMAGGESHAGEGTGILATNSLLHRKLMELLGGG
ncbi:MAG: inositol monophosphatase [Deltaproteobacteria bacterium]|jgi:myo-inositol-1(or 4)-monophosphatase|nr:inositol monophosphatase [Deltaproteobacteria bacterium]